MTLSTYTILESLTLFLGDRFKARRVTLVQMALLGLRDRLALKGPKDLKAHRDPQGLTELTGLTGLTGQ
jgi:hypothetical protein